MDKNKVYSLINMSLCIKLYAMNHVLCKDFLPGN